MINFFHRLLHPHCPDCLEKELRDKECRNCDVLMNLLEKERFEKKQLLDRLLYIPKVETVESTEEFKPVNKTAPSLRIVRENLERESARAAQLLKDKEKEMAELKKSTEELEKELLPKIEVN